MIYSVARYRHKHCGGDIRIKKNIRVYFYFRYRRKRATEYENATFGSGRLNIGKFNLDPNRFQVGWL